MARTKKPSQKLPQLPASRLPSNGTGSSALQGNGFSVVIVEPTAKRPKTAGNIAAAKQRHYRRNRQRRRDPFKTLNHDIIVLILPYLQPVDFIRSRRTSKLWKAIIELHIGRAYLAKEFPSFPIPPAIKINDGLSKEEAEAEYQYVCHLEFRRVFHHRQSFRRSMASRAFNITGVKDWHLNNHCMVHTDLKKIWVRDFRDTSRGSPGFAKPKKFRLDQSFLKGNQIIFVQLTREGDLLVTTCLEVTWSADDELWDLKWNYRNLTNYGITKFLTGEALPKVQLSSAASPATYSLGSAKTIGFQREFTGQIICKPAVGQKSLYFVQNNGLNNYSPEIKVPNKPCFVCTDLTDGTELYRKPIPESTGASDTSLYKPKQMHENDTSLCLIKQEAAAIWCPPFLLRAHVFSTATGDAIYTFNLQGTGHIKADLNLSGFWYSDIESDTRPYTVWVPLKIDEQVTEVTFGKPTHYPRHQGVLNVDDRTMGLEKVESEVDAITGPEYRSDADRRRSLDAYMGFKLVPLKLTDFYSFRHVPAPFLELFRSHEPPHGLAEPSRTEKAVELITLPLLADRAKLRRELTVSAPRWLSKDEQNYMVEGYLVRWMPDNDQLLVFDFFPRW